MKRLLAYLMSSILLLILLAGCVGDLGAYQSPAESTAPPRQTTQTLRHEAAETFAGGSGTEDDPFQISEPGHLVLLHELMQKGNGYNNINNLDATDDSYDIYVYGHYILTDDIFLNDTADYDNWDQVAPIYGWDSIGTDLKFKSFHGTLDGNGHKIVGMYIDGDISQRVKDPSGYITPGFGLFALLSGTVKNLIMEKAYICVSGYSSSAGLIAGESNYNFSALIENCTVSGTIALYNSSDAGGVVGFGHKCSIIGCTSDVTIIQLDDGDGIIGGISGYGGSVDNCIFTGTLYGNDSVGGILGLGDLAKDCVNMGTIRGERAGGICGMAINRASAATIDEPLRKIENCINEGQITGTLIAGGILAEMSNERTDICMSVIGCENKGNVIGEEAAGIIGRLSVDRAGAINVENCVNYADITGKGMTGGIICNLADGVKPLKGEVLISGCKNLGSIISNGQYSAGVITHFTVVEGATELQLTVESCVNEGTIQSTGYAGGILGFSNVDFDAEGSGIPVNISDHTVVIFRNCTNQGDVTPWAATHDHRHWGHN